MALAVCLIGLGPVRGYEPADRPLGKWERKVGKNQVTLVIEENRLHVTVTGEKACTMHADYGMTKDQIVYGVITSIEATDEDDSGAEKEMLDAPFSCRFRLDEGALIVRDLKCGAGGDMKESLWGGRFRAVAPPPARPVTASAASVGSDPLLRTPTSVVPPPPPGVAVPLAPTQVVPPPGEPIRPPTGH
jgi:hypothetical protein